MNPDSNARFACHVTRLGLTAVALGLLALVSPEMSAQSANALLPAAAQSAPPQTGPAPTAPPQASASPGGDLTQMRADLDRMESLLSNMSAEIEFLRDQNLQILLRTNAQMWTVLIRDLRRQVEREEQQHGHR